MSEVSITLAGLNCPNCAGKIERAVGKLEGVNEASLNLIKQEIIITYSGIEKADIVSKVKQITTDLEPHVIVQEKTRSFVAVGHNHTHEHNHSHSHDCDCHDHEEHSHKSADIKSRTVNAGLSGEMVKKLVRYAIGIIFFVLALSNVIPGLNLALYLISYALFGLTVLIKAVNNLRRGEVLDENFLMCISTIGAFAIGEYPEAVAVMVFYQIGEFFQDLAIDRSRESIKSLMDLKAEYANVEIDGEIVVKDPSQVLVGDVLLIKPGEKIPLDGTVIEGESQLDLSGLLGESVPRGVRVGHEVLSGALNLNGILKIKTVKDYENSTVSKIMDMVENASARKAPTEKFITKFSKVYTPLVVLAAALLAVIPPLIVPGELFSDWLYRGLVFLVVSCPCALVISVPLSFFSGIGYSSKRGVLIKGSTYIEVLSKVNTVVFDKTGTLTKGVFRVTEICPAQGVDKDRLLETAYSLEKYSNHPIAKSIIKEYGENQNRDRAIEISNFQEVSGQGVIGTLNGSQVMAGNKRLMEEYGIICADYNGFGTVVHVSGGGSYLGYIEISDIIKEDSAKAISDLKRLGVERIAMISGDKKETAEKIASEIGIDMVYAELLPHEKINAVEEIYAKNPGAVIAYAGDGINDAPVLTRVDAGIAMGGVGSDAAIEAADIVIMTDEPTKITEAINISINTMKIVKQNIAFALIVKFSVLGLSVIGIASMWLAVFADVGVALIAVLNAMRKK